MELHAAGARAHARDRSAGNGAAGARHRRPARRATRWSRACCCCTTSIRWICETRVRGALEKTRPVPQVPRRQRRAGGHRRGRRRAAPDAGKLPRLPVVGDDAQAGHRAGDPGGGAGRDRHRGGRRAERRAADACRPRARGARADAPRACRDERRRVARRPAARRPPSRRGPRAGGRRPGGAVPGAGGAALRVRRSLPGLQRPSWPAPSSRATRWPVRPVGGATT